MMISAAKFEGDVGGTFFQINNFIKGMYLPSTTPQRNLFSSATTISVFFWRNLGANERKNGFFFLKGTLTTLRIWHDNSSLTHKQQINSTKASKKNFQWIVHRRRVIVEIANEIIIDMILKFVRRTNIKYV